MASTIVYKVEPEHPEDEKYPVRYYEDFAEIEHVHTWGGYKITMGRWFPEGESEQIPLQE